MSQAGGPYEQSFDSWDGMPGTTARSSLLACGDESNDTNTVERLSALTERLDEYEHAHLDCWRSLVSWLGSWQRSAKLTHSFDDLALGLF